MNEPTLSFALREWREFVTGRRSQVTVGVIAASAAVIGPFGTAERMGFGLRLAYWSGVTVSHALIAFLVVVATFHALGRWTDRRWLRLTLAAIAASLPLSAIQIVLARLTESMPVTAANAAAIAVTTTTVTLAVTVLVGLVRSQAIAPPETEAEASPQVGRAPRADNAFLARLPIEIGRDIVSLTMQDHYIEVRTRSGSTLLLMRLTDAIRELDGLPGMQIHRSHWIARAAVARLHREDGRLQVELLDGRRLPVSRSFAADVRSAGFPE